MTDRRFKDRTPLIEWVATQPLGATTKQCMEFQRWGSDTTAWLALHKLVQAGHLCRHGSGAFSRWCVPATLPAVIDAMGRAREAANERARARSHTPEPPRKPVPRWVFDLAQTL